MRGLLLVVLGLAGAGLASVGCSRSSDSGASQAPTGPAWFEDVTERSGLRFVHDAGPVGSYPMPQIMGSGVALLDIDNDGRLDIYLVQNGGPSSGSVNRLFHQQPDGTFRDITKGSGLDVAGYGMGVAVGDVNNDGWADVLVTEYGRVRLFLNNGNRTFTEVSREAGLDSPLWGTSAAFVDYDRDGWLDLVVVNYVDYAPGRPCADSGSQRDYCNPKAFPGTVTRLYHNRGRAAAGGRVSFEDVTLRSGLGQLAGPGLGVLCADFDGDGWPDIFVANDGHPNCLWINRHDGTFVEESVLRGVAYNAMGRVQANMGVAVGDIDGDGLFDLFVTHLTEETNTYWKQGPRGLFQDRTAQSGLAGSRWRGTGFGTLLADFDHDGALDLAVANGRVARMKQDTVSAEARERLGVFWSQYAERNQLFANDGSGRFRDLSADNPALCGSGNVARGLACGDLDGDGAPDLLVTTVAGPARLYRNVAPGRGHWLMVRAVDPALNRDAYGAEITVQAAGRRQLRWINPGTSYLCSNDPRAHFGLGQTTEVEQIEVRWPDGLVESFAGGRADQLRTLKRGEGRQRSAAADSPRR